MYRRDRMRLLSLAAMAVFFAARLAAGQADSRFPLDREIDPAPAWAQPLKGGPIRVAAVYPADAPADIAALEQQIQTRLTAHPFDETIPFNDAVAAALKEKPDVLVAAAGVWSEISADVGAALEQHVQRGGGLFWIGFAPNTTPELADFLKPLGLNPAEPAPDFVTMAGGQALSGLQQGYDTLTAFRADTARAVELRYWSSRPHGHALIPLAPQDALHAPESIGNYVALLCHVLRWTAGRDPGAAFRAIEEIAPKGPVDAETPPQLPGRFVQRMQQAAVPGTLRQFSVSLDRPAPRTYDLRVQVRYPGRGISNSFNSIDEIPKGAEKITFSFPAGSGDTFIDVWLLDGEYVVDWFTQPLHLPTMPELTELSFSTAAVDANDRLRVTGNVEGQMLSAQLSTGASQVPLFVFLRVTDSLGREVARRDLVLPPAGGDLQAELPLIDLLTPYARADVFASFAAEPRLDWWTRARADRRAIDLVVRQPLPEGLSLIVDDPGEGSFAGSARRRALRDQGVAIVAPGAIPALGNIAADGVRLVADLGSLDQFPGNEFGPRTPSGIALRQAAAPYAAMQPALYTITDDSNGAGADIEPLRAAMERAIRDSDPRAALALLNNGYSAPDSGGFRVVPAEIESLQSLHEKPAAYAAVYTQLPSGERALEHSRWLPWLAALHGADALWIDGSAASPDVFASLTAEAKRVRGGFDVLFQRATPVTAISEDSLDIAPDFPGIVRAYTLGKARLYAFLAHPDGDGKGVAKIKIEGDARIHELTGIETPHAVKSLSIKLRAGEAAVAAVLPYEVVRVAIDAPASVSAGRRLTLHASVKTRGVLPSDHVLRITLAGPGGANLDHYSRTVFAPNGESTVWIPLAYSDLPGKYRVTVRDLFTGIESTVEVSVMVPQESGPASAR